LLLSFNKNSSSSTQCDRFHIAKKANSRNLFSNKVPYTFQPFFGFL
jgi:hypothetical protein